jgi:hypothetical protein
MKEITQQHIRNRNSKTQKHGVKLTENNTTYNTEDDDDDDDETVEHREHISIAVT